VYGVVRQSGGYIRLESEPGMGTTFQVYLPRVDAAALPAAERPRLESLPGGTETILFAEDDAAIRRFVIEALESLGYRVISAADGVAALRTAQMAAGGIHLLLTDLVMPGMGGRELAARLILTDPHLKVVFVSGYAGHSAAEKELDLPGVAFLQKPFSINLLANTVRTVLDEPGPQPA
jgi:two-component system, cell cycle sensor histidine kinase and response regulator CckA